MSERQILCSGSIHTNFSYSGWLNWGGGDTVLDIQAVAWPPSGSFGVQIERDISGTPTVVSGSTFTSDGATTLSALPPGRYRVVAGAYGPTTTTADGVTVVFERVL